jgi:hypothetical protein
LIFQCSQVGDSKEWRRRLACLCGVNPSVCWLRRQGFSLGTGERVEGHFVLLEAHPHEPEGGADKKTDAQPGQPEGGLRGRRVERIVRNVRHTPLNRRRGIRQTLGPGLPQLERNSSIQNPKGGTPQTAQGAGPSQTSYGSRLLYPTKSGNNTMKFSAPGTRTLNQPRPRAREDRGKA